MKGGGGKRGDIKKRRGRIEKKRGGEKLHSFYMVAQGSND